MIKTNIDHHGILVVRNLIIVIFVITVLW